MALYRIINLPGGQIGVWRLSETLADLIENFTTEELEISDYQKYSYEKRKVEWLATRVLLKILIGPDFTISYSESGKPILSHSSYKYLSISHSREFVTVYIHQDSEVGIDLECIARNYNAVEKRYLSDTELKQTGRDPVLQCLYWCAKEAIFKLVAYEGLEFREHIHILPFHPELDNQFSGCFNLGIKTIDFSLYFQVFENHCMVWVSY
jgi:4'-phosphopantetheinyl transferase EntD